MSAGTERSLVLPAIIAPHGRPSVTIGVPTAARTLRAAARSAIGPLAAPYSSMRAARPVRNTSDVTLRPPSASRVPRGSAGASEPQKATPATT